MTAAGFDIKPGEHPIVPIMLYDAVLSQTMAAKLLDEGIYVIGFIFRLCRKDRREFVCKFQRVTTDIIWIKRLLLLLKLGKELGVIQ